MKPKLILVLCLLGLFSCSRKESQDAEDKTTGNGSSTETKSNTAVSVFSSKAETGMYLATMERNRDIIKKLDPVEFKLTLTGRDGRKIENAEVEIDLTMPGMAMPDNKTKLKAGGKGIYTGTTLFTMKGSWILKAVVKTNKKQETLDFSFEVK